jgi:hypothetical protein
VFGALIAPASGQVTVVSDAFVATKLPVYVQPIEGSPTYGSTNPCEYVLVTLPNQTAERSIQLNKPYPTGTKIRTLSDAWCDLQFNKTEVIANSKTIVLQTRVRLLPNAKATLCISELLEGEIELTAGSLIVDEEYFGFAAYSLRPRFHTKTKPVTIAGIGTSYGVFLSGSTVRFLVGHGKVDGKKVDGTMTQFVAGDCRSIAPGGSFQVEVPTPYEINVTPNAAATLSPPSSNGGST